MSLRIVLGAAIILAATLMGVSNGKANLIINGGFETGISPPPTYYRLLTATGPYYGDIDGWLVADNTLDWVHNDYWTAAEGSRTIDLIGVAEPVILTTATPFATVKGLVFEVVFYLSGNFGPDNFDPKTLYVYADGQTGTFSFDRFSGWSYQNMGWLRKTWTFIADDNFASLTFTCLKTDDGGGPVLDNVSVNAVPLPSAIFLLGAGLTRLALYRRRKQTAGSCTGTHDLPPRRGHGRPCGPLIH